MNIINNILNSWSIYEWSLILGSLLSIFLITNSVTYYLTRNFRYLLSLSLTYVVSGLLLIISLFIFVFLFDWEVSNLSFLSVIFITLIININWFSLIGFYNKHKDSKKFSLVSLFKEYRKDSIRISIFLLIISLSVLIFLKGETLYTVSIATLVSIVSIYCNTVFTRNLIND